MKHDEPQWARLGGPPSGSDAFLGRIQPRKSDDGWRLAPNRVPFTFQRKVWFSAPFQRRNLQLHASEMRGMSGRGRTLLICGENLLVVFGRSRDHNLLWS